MAARTDKGINRALSAWGCSSTWVTLSRLRACSASAPEAHCVGGEIKETNGNGAQNQQQWRYIRIDERVQVVQQKTTRIRGDPGAAAEPILHRGQWARPVQDLEQDTVDQ